MPVNRYTNISLQPYQSQAIPLPFEELAQIGQQKQGEFEANKKYANDLAESLNVPARQEDIPSVHEITSKYQEKLDDLSNKAITGQQYRQELSQLSRKIKED